MFNEYVFLGMVALLGLIAVYGTEIAKVILGYG